MKERYSSRSASLLHAFVSPDAPHRRDVGWSSRLWCSLARWDATRRVASLAARGARGRTIGVHRAGPPPARADADRGPLRPWQCFLRTGPSSSSLAAWPVAILYKRAQGAVVDAWVMCVRRSLRKSTRGWPGASGDASTEAVCLHCGTTPSSGGAQGHVNRVGLPTPHLTLSGCRPTSHRPHRLDARCSISRRSLRMM